jgi:hypothetical protein
MKFRSLYFFEIPFFDSRILCQMISLLCTHCLPANRAFQNHAEIGLEHAFVLLIWQKKHDIWQNTHNACLQKQLQTALILSVTFI